MKSIASLHLNEVKQKIIFAQKKQEGQITQNKCFNFVKLLYNSISISISSKYLL